MSELEINPKLKSAIDVRGHFTFEDASDGARADHSVADEKAPIKEKAFQLRNVKLNIPRGAFVCIVGRVGTGKSALLQALLGEMRQTAGHSMFSGRVSYGMSSAGCEVRY